MTEPKSRLPDFLKDLPSRNKENFSRFVADNGIKQQSKPKSQVVCVDHPAIQVIVNEKTSILLRNLHRQYDKSGGSLRKRMMRCDSDDGDAPSSSAATSNGQPVKKLPRAT